MTESEDRQNTMVVLVVVFLITALIIAVMVLHEDTRQPISSPPPGWMLKPVPCGVIPYPNCPIDLPMLTPYEGD